MKTLILFIALLMLVGCGWTVETNYLECSYEAEKLTPTLEQQPLYFPYESSKIFRADRVHKLVYACMEARGFSRDNAKSNSDYLHDKENPKAEPKSKPDLAYWSRRWSVF